MLAVFYVLLINDWVGLAKFPSFWGRTWRVDGLRLKLLRSSISCKFFLEATGLLRSYVDALMIELERRVLAAMLFFVVEGVRRPAEPHTSPSFSGAADVLLFDDRVAFMNELDARL